MQHWTKHLRWRELQFLALMLAQVILIAGYLAGGVGGLTGDEPGGWRRIDVEAVEARLNAGELVRKEADWYHPLSEEGSVRP